MKNHRRIESGRKFSLYQLSARGVLKGSICLQPFFSTRSDPVGNIIKEHHKEKYLRNGSSKHT